MSGIIRVEEQSAGTATQIAGASFLPGNAGDTTLSLTIGYSGPLVVDLLTGFVEPFVRYGAGGGVGGALPLLLRQYGQRVARVDGCGSLRKDKQASRTAADNRGKKRPIQTGYG